VRAFRVDGERASVGFERTPEGLRFTDHGGPG